MRDRRPERRRPLGEDRAAFGDLGFAVGQVFLGDLGQIVEIVEEDVRDLRRGRINVAGQGEVDQEERAGGTALDAGGDQFTREHKVR